MAKKEFIQAIFCAPTGKYDNLPYPSRLTDEVFKSLKEAGINRIFGFGYDIRKETQIKTLELCEKYGIKYLPTMECFGKYVDFDWVDLTQEEKKNLDERFIKEVGEYVGYPAFAGVFFGDEAGYLSFGGVAHAKKIFDENYPSLEFHFNFFSYSINDAIFWGGMAGAVNGEPKREKPFELKGDTAITFANRFNFYDKLVEGLLSKAKFEFISQDKYPFEGFWKEVPTSVHVALFELNAFFAEKKRKYGCKFYNYMQAGQWMTGTPRKHMTKGEAALQAHVTAAYGNDGFAYFPGCFPIDYTFNPDMKYSEEGAGGLIDMYGNKAEVYDWVKELNEFFALIQDDILSSELKGVTSYGEYHNGFTEDEIKDLPDSECIFTGELPKYFNYTDKGVNVGCENEVMISVFEKDGKPRYYIVNLASAYKNKVKITLPAGAYEIIRKNEKYVSNENIELVLDEGEGIYIKEL